MSKREETSQYALSRNDAKRKRPQLAPEQDTEVREAFELFDPHKTSYITYHQLKVILRALGFEIKKSEVVQLAREFDIEQSGRVSYEDYIEIMKRKYSERDPIEETLKAFKLFDLEGKGRIGLNDLRKIAKELGETLKEEQLMAMIEQFDQDGDGQINQQEFLAILRPSII